MASKLVFITIMIFGSATLLQSCYGSAIPMWEFLSRSEKMSHLYTTFAKQVSDYCKTSDDARLQSVAQCKRDFLTYGLERLQSFPDVRLDIMDPYQRGANELIWEIIMKGHPMIEASSQQQQQQQNSGSAIIFGNVQSKNNYDNLQQHQHQQNPIFDHIDNDSNNERSNNGNGSGGTASSLSSYAMGMDTAYGYNNGQIPTKDQYPKQFEIIFDNQNNKSTKLNLNNEQISLDNNDKKTENQNYNDDAVSLVGITIHPPVSSSSYYQPSFSEINEKQQQPHATYLTGPMVVRVRPDGTPVEEDRNKPLPHDDDKEFMQYGQIKLPIITQQKFTINSAFNYQQQQHNLHTQNQKQEK